MSIPNFNAVRNNLSACYKQQQEMLFTTISAIKDSIIENVKE